MKNIGRYQGTPCYECTRDELYDLLREGKGNDINIYIADGVMVKKGIIIGYYDGNTVKEDYKGTPYLSEMIYSEMKSKWDEEERAKQEEKVYYSKKKSKWDDETEAEAAEVATATSYESLVKQDIDFNDYSKIVDEFFALLEGEV